VSQADGRCADQIGTPCDPVHHDEDPRRTAPVVTVLLIAKESR
jgi:hypothetical protein